MIQRLFYRFLKPGASSDGDAVPTPDLSRVFPHLRNPRASQPSEDAAEREPAPVAADPAEPAARPAEPAAAAELAGFIEEDVEALRAAFARFRDTGGTGGTSRALFLAAHNLRGIVDPDASPVLSRICASLCSLLAGRTAGPADAPLINLHVEAIRAALRASQSEAADRLGQAVCVALEDQVRTRLSA